MAELREFVEKPSKETFPSGKNIIAKRQRHGQILVPSHRNNDA